MGGRKINHADTTHSLAVRYWFAAWDCNWHDTYVLLDERRMIMYQHIIDKLRSIQSRSKGDLLRQAIDALEQLQQELKDERYRHDRYRDFEVAEAEQLRQMRIERDMLAKKLREVEERQNESLA